MAIRVSSKKPLSRKVQQRQFGVVVIAGAIIAGALIIRTSSDSAEAKISNLDLNQSVLVPVPEEPIPVGTKLKHAKFKTVSFPRGQLPDDALLNLDSYLDAETKTALPANLPLFPNNLGINSSTQNAVAGRIPPGMRAMTVSVDETSAVEGWAEPGSIVDVLLQEHERTSVIAEKVKILSAARNVTPGEGSPKSVPNTVTLLVTQEQCLAINTAIPLGKIGFVLRGNTDEQHWVDRSFTAANLKNTDGNEVVTSRREVNGYISVKDKEGNSQSFALSDGKWVKSEVTPQGFLVAKQPEGTNE